VHTEITDNNAGKPTGWIYFDAECRFCVAHRRRWGQVFESRGFVWLPLQTPGAAEQLGVTDQELRTEMWLQFADGRKFGGVDAWVVMLRRVWWLAPLGFVLALPGLNAAGRGFYRWIAKHRQCLGGACAIPAHRKTKRPRHTVFFHFP
jgi:predicted DCC family thiol-disulfide oxidoreductase YuxK